MERSMLDQHNDETDRNAAKPDENKEKLKDPIEASSSAKKKTLSREFPTPRGLVIYRDSIWFKKPPERS
jgi:hypothetical protein